MTISRRRFIHSTAGAGLALGMLKIPWLAGCGKHTDQQIGERQRLRMPPLWTGGALSASMAMHDLGDGKMAQAMTFGGSFPGPTIRVRAGEMFSAQLTNQLGEPTNIHWHGLTVPADMDGHPMDPVAPGGSRMYRYPVKQRAGTYFYHPHPHEAAAKQVYMGMAGLFLVQDEEEAALGLPTGEMDVSLLLQDRRFAAARSFDYAPMMQDLLDGYLGDSVLVNGVPDPYLEVSAGLYRLRLINGANARIFKVAFADMRTFQVIAGDGGLLSAPVPATSVWLGPGERVELLVSFGADAMGTSVMLRSLSFPVPSGGHGGHGGGMSASLPQGSALDLLRFDVMKAGTAGKVPERLARLERLDPAQARRTRTFTLGMRMAQRGLHTINDKIFDVARMDERVPFGETEIWEFRSMDEGAIHPMHLHGAQLQVLSRSGGPLQPGEQGWKDTVLVFPGETVRTLVRMDGYRGLYLVHCHTLEHEDDGMMLNVEVT